MNEEISEVAEAMNMTPSDLLGYMIVDYLEDLKNGIIDPPGIISEEYRRD